ncbi:MAG: right-handed parallel beta-helix repeat-containing protein [Bacteroidales bacterium]
MLVKPKNILFFIGIIAAIISCERYELNRSSDARLAFSTDTVFFDTIFTTLGSATKRFRIYNNDIQPIEVTSIELAGGTQSVFRLNIDGYASHQVSNIEIPPEDSLFIFVEVTLDPNNMDSILRIQDSIVFLTNGNVQDVDLVAWGQDVHLLSGDTLQTSTWINDKPYLILDYIMVDSLQTLTLEEGVRIHMHRDAWMIVKGTLLANGSLEQPIVIQGDRLEYLYRDIPGQWGGIYFWPGSRENHLEHVTIKNGMYGLWADTVMTPGIPTLNITNCVIQDMSAIGIIGRGAAIHADNTVIGSCGQFSIFMSIGGSYEFYHCTVANYWGSGFSNRTTPAVAMKNYYQDAWGGIQVRPIDKAYFGNCILYGNKEYELAVDEHPSSQIPYHFDHSLVKVDPDEFDLNDQAHFVNVINLEDPRFVNPDYKYNNFQLDTLSPAKDVAFPDIAIQYPLDILGVSRLGTLGPDMGAYERVENDSISK